MHTPSHLHMVVDRRRTSLITNHAICDVFSGVYFPVETLTATSKMYTTHNSDQGSLCLTGGKYTFIAIVEVYNLVQAYSLSITGEGAKLIVRYLTSPNKLLDFRLIQYYNLTLSKVILQRCCYPGKALLMTNHSHKLHYIFSLHINWVSRDNCACEHTSVLVLLLIFLHWSHS